MQQQIKTIELKNQFIWHSNNAGKILAETMYLMQGSILEDRKCGRWPQRLISFILWHNSWEYSEFTGMPWRISRKSTCCLSQETGILRKSFLRILHDDLKLFPYKIQILQRQTDQNKAGRETFCKYIIQRIENDPSLLDLNDLNNVDHCGLCAASATLAVSPNLATKCWINLLSGTLFLPKSLLHYCCVKRSDFAAEYTFIIFTCCCVVNHSFGSILVLKEYNSPAVYTTLGWKTNQSVFFGRSYMLDETESKTMHKDKKRWLIEEKEVRNWVK